MAKPSPSSSFKDPGRIGQDVFIRDPEDATIQYKARTFSINYDAKESDIGLFPRRWGTFSELHLPAEYRITVPLADLSLEPFAGAAQRGFEDVLIERGEKPSAWMDNAGRVHQPGCEEPGATAPATVVGEGGVPEPEFSDESLTAISAVVGALAKDPAVQALCASDAPVETPKGVLPAGVTKAQVVEALDRGAKPRKPPLFTKAEVLEKLDGIKGEMDKLRRMLEAVL